MDFILQILSVTWQLYRRYPWLGAIAFVLSLISALHPLLLPE